MIRNVTREDAERIAEIYNHYILNTIITFEEICLTSGEICQRIAKLEDLKLPWIVIEQDQRVVGYAYAGVFRERAAYRYSTEVSVYLDHQVTGGGLGTQLFAELLNRLEQTSMHTVIGGIALPNAASVALHEKFGLRKVAEIQQVGFKFDRWIDVGYWQKIIK
ncbi:GNAT family N-acetyltransferase [Gynuella sunshinyii]|uniref:Sortase and related acyltransferase n=1 Tax=Gynuella sunshinyii YC6258 TaxID=1445510 RepID=A0A0C5VIW0_9GAMM|nr:GNAT family N-acetyltransferase [Gynuella sunshinyii]AJQ93283.1 sortase and related acyltransferase [Gynuella sunshinyii YC6258]